MGMLASGKEAEIKLHNGEWIIFHKREWILLYMYNDYNKVKVIPPKVAWIIPPLDHDVHTIFKAKGFWTERLDPNTRVNRLPESLDYVVFCGGTDVDPEYYGERREARTQHPDVTRDYFETNLYRHLPARTVKVGICRGGQLLHIMNGGKLKQHINGHGGTPHNSITKDGKIVLTSSVHHQAMLHQDHGDIFLKSEQDDVIEGVWYPETKSFCVQGHPEWGPKEYTNYFFDTMLSYTGDRL